MAKLLYLQCQAGISGDMFLSALLDAGLDQREFRQMLGNMGISEPEVTISRVIRKGVTATALHVDPKEDRHHLHVEDIRRVISSSGLKPAVIEAALEVFERIVAAESRVHGVPMDKVHLHEVSGLDTIVDLLGVAWGLDRLGIDRVYATPLNTGSGSVHFSHGVVPVPAPATAILLTGIPVIDDGLPGERTTPTGAALAAVFVDSFDPPGAMRPLATGYGAGRRDDGDRPNVLRAIIAESDEPAPGGLELERLIMIETDVDDDTPEMIAYLSDRLMRMEGILDVSVLATCRKKGRPGHLIRVLCRPESASAARETIFRESTSLGLREIDVSRYKRNRQVKTVDTQWGPVRVICSESHVAPEYEDCRLYAERADVSLREVYNDAVIRLKTAADKKENGVP